MNNTKNIADTLQQNFESNKKENITKQFNDNIINSEPNINMNNKEKYSNSEPNININNKKKYNNNDEIIENNTDINAKTNKKIINSYEILKNNQNDNKNRIKNKNEYEENQFIDYLREAMLHESKIEQLKINLSLRSDFNWEEVFRIFELEGRGFLSKEDLIIGFNKFGIYPKDSDISLLLKRYDLKKEGFISYPDFFDLIVPFSKYHRIMVDKRKINGENNMFNPNEFSRETLDCMRNVFVSIFNGEFILNKMRESFTSLKMKFNDIFQLMVPIGKGFLGEKELAIFLQKIGIFKNSNDCDLIFLRLNKKRNGKIDFQEMCDEIEAEY
jgi:Ca2+-binding EF-hand superfamily protein